jgi:hypothetical protein
MGLKNYTTRQQIENYLLITIDPTFYNQVDSWMEEIEAYIDQMTGRNFKADTNASAKYYDGDDSMKILVDDAVAITEVNISGDILTADTDPLLADGDFIFYPANKLPITKIELRGGYFPCWPKRAIKITGKWGYSVAVPTDITTVATVLVAGLINYSYNADGEVKSESIGRYTVTYKDEKQWQDFERIDKIIQYYKKFVF